MSIGTETTIATIADTGGIAIDQILIGAVCGAMVASIGALILFRRLGRAAIVHDSRDSVTGLADRRSFVERLEIEWLAAKDDSHEFGMLLIDVDAFGDINQLYGHTVGDQVLAEIADRVRLRLSPDDFVARLEADEFAAIVSPATFEQLASIRRGLEAYVNHAQSVPVMLSIGIGVPLDDDERADDVLRRARRSMLERRDQRPTVMVDEALAELIAD